MAGGRSLVSAPSGPLETSRVLASHLTRQLPPLVAAKAKSLSLPSDAIEWDRVAGRAGSKSTGKLRRVPSSRRSRRQRTRRLIAAAITLVIAGGIGGGAYIGYTNVKKQAAQLQASLTADLQAGQSALEAGKASLTQANTKHDVSLVAQATAHFVAAEGDFRAAGQLADGSLLLRALEGLPQVGGLAHSRHTAVTGIANMGVAVATAGQDLAELDGQLIKPAASGQGGRTLLTVLGQTQPTLVKVRDDLTRAQISANDVDISVLPTSQQATFVKARDTIATALTGIDEFERLVPVLKEVLGGNGYRTYLIEQVNPAELRAGGGFIGTYSVLRADHGTLKVLRSGDAYDLANPRPSPGQPGFIPLPIPYREVIPQVSWSFVDSNIYPDFPSNAKAAERFAQPRIGVKLDAVISMDYYTVAKMLELTGPMTVPGFGTTVTATNFIPQIVKAEIAGLGHKAILAAIAGPLMSRVSALPASKWPALIGALNGLSAERHLQAYFNNATAEQEIERVGWSGSVNPTDSHDYMMEVESNYYGDKVNYFLTRHYSVVLTRNGGTLHHQITVSFLNNTRCFSYDRTSYKADARLFVSGTATSLSNNLRRVKYANPAPPAGLRLLDGWPADVLCAGGRSTAVFRYDTPWTAQGGANESIYWQKQPGTINDRIDVTWNNGNGHTYKVGGSLAQDRIITLSPTGVTLTPGQPAQATLPSLSLG